MKEFAVLVLSVLILKWNQDDVHKILTLFISIIDVDI